MLLLLEPTYLVYGWMVPRSGDVNCSRAVGRKGGGSIVFHVVPSHMTITCKVSKLLMPYQTAFRCRHAHRSGIVSW